MSYFSQTKGDRGVKSVDNIAAEIKQQTPAMVRKPAQDMVSTFGPGLLVTGNVTCTGAVQIFGRVIGDIHAARLLISKGADVDGTVMAQETAIEGHFKGTIHSNSVKLQSTAVVEGEIFKQSLVIEENAQFEGVARRLTTAIDAPTTEQVSAAKSSPGIAPSVQPQAPATQPGPGTGGDANATSDHSVGLSNNGQFYNSAAGSNGPGTSY